MPPGKMIRLFSQRTGTKAPIPLPSPTGGPYYPPGRQAAPAANPAPRWLMKPSSTTRRGRRPRRPVPRPSSFVGHDDPACRSLVPPRRAITTQSQRQNYQAFLNLVSQKAGTPERPQPPRPHPFVPRPNVPRKPVLSSPPERIPKERPAGLSFGRFKVGLGGKSKSPRESFLGSARGYSFDLKRISSRKPPTFVGGSGGVRSPRPTARPHRGQFTPAPAGSSQRRCPPHRTAWPRWSAPAGRPAPSQGARRRYGSRPGSSRRRTSCP